MRAEDRFVERLRAMLAPDESLLLGPGDDAAVLRRPGTDVIATTDLLVEGIDFLPGEDPERLGRRAVAVNLSDAAAMGARPTHFLLSIALPAEADEEFALAVCRGAVARGREHGALLAGGDLSRAPCVFVSVALWGELDAAPLSRSGARPGDLVYLSGATGRAAAGLAIAKSGGGAPLSGLGLSAADASGLLDAYRDPEPRVALGLALARGGRTHAAIDVSDGLGIDAGRIADASRVRVLLERDRLPFSSAVAAAATREGVDPWQWVLGGGDDYELLFAADGDAAGFLSSLPSNVAVTHVGRVEEGSGAFLRSPEGDREIGALGWDHLEARA